MSGITVDGDKLIIHLTKKDGGLISKLTTPFACAVTKDTPVDPKGVHTPAGAGPYYIADYTPNRSIVLKKNPNYTRLIQRPAYADEIDYTQLTDRHRTRARCRAEERRARLLTDAVVPAQNFQLNKEFGPDGTARWPQRFFITPRRSSHTSP